MSTCGNAGVEATAANRVLALYRELESRWNVVDRTLDYGRLVTPNGNSVEPVHRWFHVKEAYSQALVPTLLEDSAFQTSREASFLDPFSGSGTTLVSAAKWAHDAGVELSAASVEANPVLQVVSSAKVAGLTRGRNLISPIERAWNEIVRRLREDSAVRETASATLNNTLYFDRYTRDTLIGLGYFASQIDDPDVRATIQTAIASAVERAGRIRRDGRALRYVPDKVSIDPVVSTENTLDRIKEDLRDLDGRDVSTALQVVRGDARECHQLFSEREFDWVICSPPYPNNIDYTEVYKVEAWALGLYADAAAVRRQRLSTLRSHTSIYSEKASESTGSERHAVAHDVISALHAVIPDDRYRRGRRELVEGYVDDMLEVLHSVRAVVKQSGYLALTVGNSLHGKADQAILIASDLILARLAELAHWKVEELRVARFLKRRGVSDRLLRESVLILRPA